MWPIHTDLHEAQISNFTDRPKAAPACPESTVSCLSLTPPVSLVPSPSAAAAGPRHVAALVLVAAMLPRPATHPQGRRPKRLAEQPPHPDTSYR